MGGDPQGSDGDCHNGWSLMMSGETVTVASKLPFPLIIRAFDMVKRYDDGGKREIEESRERANLRFTIQGVPNPASVKSRTENMAQIIGGYALTPNVPADLWKAWFEDNKTSDYVINKLIYARDKSADVEAIAKNNAKAARSGLEPLNPEKIIKNGQRIPADPRIPHKIDPNEGPMA
jgi:hypothetical protein